MPYELDLAKEDTTSLLELVSYANPTTIGELLTYGNTDITDFTKVVVTQNPSTDLVLVEHYPDMSLHLYGTAEEVANDLGGNLSVINAALAAAGPAVDFGNTPALFDHWAEGAINVAGGLELLPVTGPWTVDEVGYMRPADSTTETNRAFCITGPTTRSQTPNGTNTVVEATITVSEKSSAIGTVGVGFKRPDGVAVMVIPRISNSGGHLYIQRGTTGTASGPIPTTGVASIQAGVPFRLKCIATTDGFRAFINDSLIANARYTNDYSLEVTFKNQPLRPIFIHSGSDKAVMRATVVDTIAPVKGWASVVNAGTAQVPINLKATIISEAVFLGINTTGAAAHGTAITFSGYSSVKLVNRSYLPDTVSVKYNRIALTDIMTLPPTDPLWGWYDSSEWLQSRDIPLAIQMFKDKCIELGIDIDRILRNLNVTRVYEDAMWYLDFTFDSYVLKDLEFSRFKLPVNFSDSVTRTDLNGFVYSPINSDSVVF